MNAELKELGEFANQYGFLILYGIAQLTFSYLLFRYFTKTIEKKDCDFLEYAAKRDSQMTELVHSHNSAFEKNTVAIRENTMATHQVVNLFTGGARKRTPRIREK